ncbi:hypothetical protein [Capnocytophaga canis]|uniref:hypothetical protein n=1 Tax=Capnocytophaga canis TaxID=1848903 RepID=UPI00385D88AE
MDADIQLITDSILTQKTKHLQTVGVVICKIFLVDMHTYSKYKKHLEVARHTLLEVKKESDVYYEKKALEKGGQRSDFFEITIDLQRLEHSGSPITPAEFMGWQYDITTQKLLVRGQKYFLNNYFFHDTIESSENIVKTFTHLPDGFAYAVLNPPHSLQVGKNIFEKGSYFLDFCQTLFTDIERLEIYQWSDDTSNFFDAGKEWWGTFFYTVYNPIENIYIGIVASSTD